MFALTALHLSEAFFSFCHLSLFCFLIYELRKLCWGECLRTYTQCLHMCVEDRCFLPCFRGKGISLVWHLVSRQVVSHRGNEVDHLYIPRAGARVRSPDLLFFTCVLGPELGVSHCTELSPQ